MITKEYIVPANQYLASILYDWDTLPAIIATPTITPMVNSEIVKVGGSPSPNTVRDSTAAYRRIPITGTYLFRMAGKKIQEVLYSKEQHEPNN